MNDANWLSYINTTLLGLLSIGGTLTYRVLAQLRTEVAKMNGRVGRLEEFRAGHEAWCGERQTRNDREHGELHAEIRDTRQSVEALRQEAFKLSPKTPE